MKRYVPLLCGMACLVFVSVARSQTIYDSATAGASSLTAAPFLRMNPDVRSSAIGQSGIALQGNNITHYANPARMVQVSDKSAVSLSYTPWMNNLVKNVALYAVSGYFKSSDNEVISAGVRYFKQGQLNQTDESGQSFGVYNPYDLAIDASYSRKLSEVLYIGATFRYIYSQILSTGFNGYQNGSAVAADLGLYYQSKENEKGQTVSLGGVVTNIGSKLKYNVNSPGYALPATAGIGGAFNQKMTDEDRVIFTADLLTPITQPVAGKGFFQDRIQFNFGGEYDYHSLLFVRAGFSHESTAFDGYEFVTTGIGLNVKSCRVDLAYLIPSGSTTSSIMSNTFKIGFSFIIK